MSAGWNARKALEEMSSGDRAIALAELRAMIDTRLAETPDWETYWPAAHAIIQELKVAGHDLWSHDYDGAARQLWGWDYMRMETAGKLQIQFNFNAPCQTFWRDTDGRLGVDRDRE